VIFGPPDPDPVLFFNVSGSYLEQWIYKIILILEQNINQIQQIQA